MLWLNEYLAEHPAVRVGAKRRIQECANRGYAKKSEHEAYQIVVS